MIYSQLLVGQTNDILDKTVAIERMMQKTLGKRLDGMVFRAVASETTFNSEMPHADNVISIVQVDSTEVHIYKGDTRIFLGEDPQYGNHMILINFIDP
jgi:hypothetical protein